MEEIDQECVVNEPIIVNDLLSFMICKAQVFSKEKLLNSVRDFYPESAVLEAQKVLLSSIPHKKSTRHGRRVKNPDPLIVIYECLQLISPEDLPTIVCKDLNNVPEVNTIIKDKKLSHNKNIDRTFEQVLTHQNCNKIKEEQLSESDPSDDPVEEIFVDNFYTAKGVKRSNKSLIMTNDFSIYKKEQMQMRCQISEMVAIISELKDGLKKFENTFEISKICTNIPKERRLSCESIDSIAETRPLASETCASESSSTHEANVTNCKMSKVKLEGGSQSFKNCSKNFVAQIQKYIDEDDEKDISEDMEEADKLVYAGNDIYIDDYELNLDIFAKEDEQKTLILKSSDVKQRINKKGMSMFKHPIVKVLNNTDKVIVIQEEDKGSQPTIIPNCNFSLDMENSMEISSINDYMEHIEEIVGSPEISADNSMSSYHMATEEGELISKNQKYHLQCPICAARLNSIYELRKHNIQQHMSKCSFDCTLCSESFSTRSELHNHFVSCLEEMKQTQALEDRLCHICGSFYAYPKSLRIHMIYHSPTRKLSCPHCSLRYYNSNALELHIKNNHSPLNMYFCKFCPLSFISNHFLVCHTWSHTGEKPFKCGVCDFRSATITVLRSHLQTHSGQKKVKCKICNFTCIGFSKLTKHMQHDHSNSMVCPRAGCGRTYVHYFQYKRHCEAHLEEAKFQCSLCLYSTSVKSSEIKHIKTHSSPNYQCPECLVNLASKHNVARHLKSYCRKKFPLVEDK